jgi:hypothetical protein
LAGELDDLHRFDPTSGTWEQIVAPSPVNATAVVAWPTARDSAGFAATGGQLYLTNGFDGNGEKMCFHGHMRI